ncbi:Homeotic protein caudal, partial [Gryllus bimaculatus]
HEIIDIFYSEALSQEVLVLAEKKEITYQGYAPPPGPPPPAFPGAQLTGGAALLAVAGKTRTKDKYRVVYSDHQRLELEKEFHYSRYITIRRKAELAARPKNCGLCSWEHFDNTPTTTLLKLLFIFLFNYFLIGGNLRVYRKVNISQNKAIQLNIHDHIDIEFSKHCNFVQEISNIIETWSFQHFKSPFQITFQITKQINRQYLLLIPD